VFKDVIWVIIDQALYACHVILDVLFVIKQIFV
jgi:hypothetical protein